jgi:hypothetical protein
MQMEIVLVREMTTLRVAGTYSSPWQRFYLPQHCRIPQNKDSDVGENVL